MNPVIEAATVGLIRVALTEFINWTTRKARPEGWVPTAEDVEAFLSQVEHDTPEALKAKVAADLGVPWPPPMPPEVLPPA